MRSLLSCLALIVFVGVASGQERRPVVVASKNFPESHLLGEIIAQLIEQETDIPVERKFDLGYSTIVFEALRDGVIDIYPEYTGTAWEEYLKVGRRVESPLVAYMIVAERMEKELGLKWLRPMGFENSFALAMTEDRASELQIDSISDLGKHADHLRVRVSPDFYQRNDGWRPLAEDYQLDIDDVNTLEHGLAYAALESGNIDVIDAWTTDGKIDAMNLRLLRDDRSFWPPYDCAAVVRTETLRRYPELEGVLNDGLAFKIDNRTMKSMNTRVENLGNDPRRFQTVATAFLNGEFKDVDEAERISQQKHEASFPQFMLSRLRATGELTVEHLVMTGIAVGLAVLLSVPLGILMTRRPIAAPWVLGTAGVIQTIPSLALLAVMVAAGLGLGQKSAIAALFLYALLPIVRNTYTGIKGVDPDLIEAARGIGLTDTQILFKVELPLATRTIMAGIRTSTVISIGVATLAAYIGAGGLGRPIVTGLQLNDTNWILSGAIPAALLALLVDHLLGWVEWIVRPRGI